MARVPKPSGAKSTFGHPRDLSDSRKPVGTRFYQKQIIIVVEGTKTERFYFEDLARDFHVRMVKISVMDSGGKTAPFQIIEKAMAIRAHFKAREEWEEDEDEIWCAFDTEDGSNHAGLLEVYAQADKEKINLAISNPSFEYWYLLHYEETDREFSNAEAVISRLRYFIKKYEKNKSIYPKIKACLPTALQHAQKLRIRNRFTWEARGNPSTEVDILVSIVKSLSES